MPRKRQYCEISNDFTIKLPEPKRTKISNEVKVAETDRTSANVTQTRVDSSIHAQMTVIENSLDDTHIFRVQRSKRSLYMEDLIKVDQPFHWFGNVVIAECDDEGRIDNTVIMRKYRLLLKGKHIRSESGEVTHSSLHCDCAQGEAHFNFINTLSEIISDDDFDNVIQRENKARCIHVSVAHALLPMVSRSIADEEQEQHDVLLIRDSPLLALTHSNSKIGLIQRDVHRRLECRVCKFGHHCHHIDTLQKWCSEMDIDWDSVYSGEIEEKGRSNNRSSVSKQRIPYPLPKDLQTRYNSLACGLQSFPSDIYPSSEGKCIHGNTWDAADPINAGWCLGTCKIYKMTCTISEVVQDGEQSFIYIYYRPTTRKICDCIKYVDGQELLLLNVNNKVLVDYGLLFEYMFMMSESRNPLAAFHRGYSKTLNMLTGEIGLTYDMFRQAYYDFTDLMNVKWNELFICEECGTTPEIVVCDGTSLGYKKSWKERSRPHELEQETQPTEIAGMPHKKWAYIADLSLRKLILRFSGSRKGLKPSEVGITGKELEFLKEKLGQKQRVPLVKVLESESCQMQITQGCYLAKEPYRSFLEDIARNTPVHALLQGANLESLRIMDQIHRGLDILSQEYEDQYSLLASEMPILLKFLVNTSCNGKCDLKCISLIHDILTFYKKSFQGLRCYTVADYSESPESEYSFFPNLGVKHGRGTYKKDASNSAESLCREDSCTKYSSGHPSLTPGIFTVFCRHGINYGFVAMESYESPKVPFDIFLRRFEEAPKFIVYDNACKLHQYSLNREPDYFSKTTFVCDRMHWRNHVGCSSGYNIDEVTRIDTKSINTQVNEQANAGLKRLKGQTSYMNPKRFMFTVALFLALKNQMKKKS